MNNKYLIKRAYNNYTKMPLANKKITSAAIGSVVGAATGLLADKEGDTASKIGSAVVGAGVGAGTGVGLDYGIRHGMKHYKSWIGPKKVKALNNNYQNYQPGDILAANRGKYSHMGIYVGDGKVVEYGVDAYDPRAASRRKVPFSIFAGSSPVTAEAPSGNFTRQQVVDRAISAIGTDPGKYNIRNNNCEHFAREIANGVRESNQVSNLFYKPINRLKESILKTVHYSQPSATTLLTNQGKLSTNSILNSNALFNVRKNLTSDLGGMSHFDRNQTTYLSGAGSILGAGIGTIRAKKKAKKDAKKYGLKKGTLEYDNFMKSRKREGFLKGAGIGAGIGFGASKGVDTIRGKVIADKMGAKYGINLDKNGRNYMKFGKNMRGINSEEQVSKISNNWAEVGDYVKNAASII